MTRPAPRPRLQELNASGSLDNFGGEFKVPSYRGSSFLDPKGRGASTGYDTAVALPAAGDAEELAKENNKSAAGSKGTMVLSTAKYDPTMGEIAGVFESVQPSDTDLGAKVRAGAGTRGAVHGSRRTAFCPSCAPAKGREAPPWHAGAQGCEDHGPVVRSPDQGVSAGQAVSSR